jgi:hypothetical protein
MIPGFILLPLQFSALKTDLNTAGLRPRTTPYSFFTPKKSRQKKAPRLLARLWRVPSATQTF